MTKGKTGQQASIAVLGALFLAATYVGIGYACCAGIPFVAEKVAYATVDDADSPFDRHQLVEGALAVRDYSFGSHDLAALEDAVRGMNEQAGTPYAHEVDILDAPVQYSLDRDQVAHLDDVNDLAGRAMMPILGVAAIAAFLLFAGFRMFGARTVSNMLLAAGVAVIVAMGVVGVCALVSFDGFFGAFHSALFAEGTWTFPADSLLITMLPEPFWAGMGAVWLFLSLALSVLSVVLGAVLRRRTCK